MDLSCIHEHIYFLKQLHLVVILQEKFKICFRFINIKNVSLLFIVEIIAEMSIRCVIIRNIRGTLFYFPLQKENGAKLASRCISKAKPCFLSFYSLSLCSTDALRLAMCHSNFFLISFLFDNSHLIFFLSSFSFVFIFCIARVLLNNRTVVSWRKIRF